MCILKVYGIILSSATFYNLHLHTRVLIYHNACLFQPIVLLSFNVHTQGLFMIGEYVTLLKFIKQLIEHLFQYL